MKSPLADSNSPEEPTEKENAVDTIKRAWGKEVEIARRRKGMTQVDLAKMIGSSQPAIGRIERGEVDPPLAMRLAISEALDTPHDELFTIGEGVA